MRRTLTPDIAARLAATALGHVVLEYPNKLDHVLAGAADLRTPSSLHPVFYGSLDWHSCVHGYWLLARLLRLTPDIERASDIRALFDRQLVPEKIEQECRYLAAPESRRFERPYGWAWLLKLASELRRSPQNRWAQALSPLAALVARRFTEFLPIASYPVRAGTHANTAFALRMATDYTEGGADDDLARLLVRTGERWYGDDVGCCAWGEPGGDDFQSPTLVQAECMRRLWPAERFAPWFEQFLPRLAERRPATLFRPAVVSDRSDGKIAHLDGLNLSRAWCFRSLAGALPAGDPRAAVMLEAAELHLDASLPHLDGHYMGEHWLASFALLALDA